MRKKIGLNYRLLIVFSLLVRLGVIIFGIDTYNVQRGKSVFQEQGCIACHAVYEISDSTIGPSLGELANRAGNRVASLSANEYIRQSMINPHVYVVEGWSPTCNPPHFSNIIDERELNNLVIWLLTLSSE